MLRVSDADRDRVAALLGDACAAGYLDTTELDDRLGRTMTARTQPELAAVTADLPESWLHGREMAQREPRRRAVARAGVVAHVSSYVGVIALLVGIWLTVALATGAWYPWPVWPAMGWGIGVASHVLGVRTGRAGRGCGAQWYAVAERMVAGGVRANR